MLSLVLLNADRHITGVLRGFDQFMNIVLDNTIDEKMKIDIGMVVRIVSLRKNKDAVFRWFEEIAL